MPNLTYLALLILQTRYKSRNATRSVPYHILVKSGTKRSRSIPEIIRIQTFPINLNRSLLVSYNDRPLGHRHCIKFNSLAVFFWQN